MKGKTHLVSAILLAAGKSERMGQNKLLLPWLGGTIIGRTLDNLIASQVREVVVVLGSRAQEMSQAIGGRKVIQVLNPNYAGGMSTSLDTGLGMVGSQARWVMVALADQPLIPTETYDRLIEAALASDKGIIVPTYKNRRGNPIILASVYIPELLRLAGDVGGRELLERYPRDVLEVPVEAEGVVININTMDEYALRFKPLSQKRKG